MSDIFKPLIELTDELKIITEATENGKTNMFLEGIAVQAEVVNGNKRLYPLHVIQPEVEVYVEKKLKFNTATGELNHPKENVQEVNPDRISHRFVEIVQEKNDFWSKALILNTVCGTQVKNLNEGGVRLGMSSRALGKLSVQNNVNIVEKMMFVTFGDIVIDPSAPDAWQQAIFENQEWVFENGILVKTDVSQEIDDAKNKLNSVPKSIRTEVMTECFKNYLNKIKINYM